MRIGLNATCFNDRPSGARQRFVGLYSALIAAQPDTEFVIYDPIDARVSDAFGGAANVTARQTPIPSSGRLRKAIAAAGYWQRQLRADRLDLFEQFNLPLVKAPDCPTLLTVHDIRDAQAASALPRLVYRALWHRALAGADHVVTVSDTMRDELLAFDPGTAVTTIYNGIDPAPFAAAAREAAPGDYLLAVGHLEPRKNYAGLIAALALLGGETRLVIVGRDSGSRAAVDAAIAAAGVADRVTIRSDVADATLARLYAECALLVFPSTYEGFGIPLLEAMAARRPVVTSDIAVFRELTEQQGSYFDPADPAAIAAAIAAVRDDPARAAALVEYGTVRLRDFAFPRLAAQLTTLHAALA